MNKFDIIPCSKFFNESLIIIFIIGFKLFIGLFNKDKKMFYENFSNTYIANGFKLNKQRHVEVHKDDMN